MAENDKTNDKAKESSIDYSGSQSEIDKAKAKARDDDKARLAEEHAQMFGGKRPDITPAQLIAALGFIVAQAVAFGIIDDAKAQSIVALGGIVLPAVIQIADAVIRYGRNRALAPPPVQPQPMEYLRAGIVVKGELTTEMLDWISQRIDRVLYDEALMIAATLSKEATVTFEGADLTAEAV